MNGGSLQRLVDFVRDEYATHDAIPLHGPVFAGREREYVVDCIDSTYVSSVGAYVGIRMRFTCGQCAGELAESVAGIGTSWGRSRRRGPVRFHKTSKDDQPRRAK